MYEAIQLVGISDLGILGVLMLLISSLVSLKNFRKRDVNPKTSRSRNRLKNERWMGDWLTGRCMDSFATYPEKIL